MTHPNATLIESFYRAFDAHDGRAMAACYAADAHFSDPVFTNLRGREPGAMWQMLTQDDGDLRIELLDHDADDRTGSAHWLAHYTFSQTGRPVVNDIQTTFAFLDRSIAEQRDVFDFARWSRQAFGILGTVLGPTPVLRAIVRRKARASLDEFLAEHP